MKGSTGLSQNTGQTPIALHRNTCLDAPIGDILLAAVAKAAATDIAFSNGWRSGVPIPEAPVTTEDLWNIAPVDPPVSRVDLTGTEILEMMEANIEHMFARDPFGQMGGYVKRFRGLTPCVKLENPKGQRIDQAFCKDGPLVLDKSYAVGFITAQGVPKSLGRNRQDLEIHAIAALQDWFCAPAFLPDDSIAGAGRLIVV